MERRSYYQQEAQVIIEGELISRRIQRAAAIFRRHLPSVDRLLDIGCGTGEIALYFQRALQAKEAYGVEIAEKRAEAARDKGVKAQVCDVGQEALPFPDGHFDAVFCGEVIEHLFDTDHLLDEAARVLSARGVFILTTPNLASWYNRLVLLLGMQPFMSSVSLRHNVGRPKFWGSAGCGHIRLFTFCALKELLQQHRFVILGARGEAAAHSWELRRVPLPARLVDGLFALVPSLSADVTFAVRKGPAAQSGQP
ncbi:MAG: class I SAM-dependent methyltransferase [Chloroflexi bacterium]|nr:class I SAM-dependent methyltransferase [Chloroflexota bacterium]